MVGRAWKANEQKQRVTADPRLGSDWTTSCVLPSADPRRYASQRSERASFWTPATVSWATGSSVARRATVTRLPTCQATSDPPMAGSLPGSWIGTVPGRLKKPPTPGRCHARSPAATLGSSAGDSTTCAPAAPAKTAPVPAASAMAHSDRTTRNAPGRSISVPSSPVEAESPRNAYASTGSARPTARKRPMASAGRSSPSARLIAMRAQAAAAGTYVVTPVPSRRPYRKSARGSGIVRRQRSGTWKGI